MLGGGQSLWVMFLVDGSAVCSSLGVGVRDSCFGVVFETNSFFEEDGWFFGGLQLGNGGHGEMTF